MKEPLLIKSATILNPTSIYNEQSMDVLVINGRIKAIEKEITASTQTQIINGNEKFLSIGFFDLNVNFFDPGDETKENIHTGIEAAAAGGFTAVALMPNTEPPLHSKAEIAYVLHQAKNKLVDVYPLGTISRHRQGQDLAELYDMALAGAIAFSDGNRPIQEAGFMNRAMLYAKGINRILFSYANDLSLSGHATMHEGETSTYLGMKGIPYIAEELIIARDICLAAYNNAKLHFSTISTARAVELIRLAKRRGIQVSCDVAAHHLVLTDRELITFDTNYKVSPPLRTLADKQALLEGLADGTIDAVVSQHTPHEIEKKAVEFEIAENGIIGLQTVMPLLLKAGLSVREIVKVLALNPRKILDIPEPSIAIGEEANLVLFDTHSEWEYGIEKNRSKSFNTPFLNHTLKGKIHMICHKSQLKTYE